jgi:flagellar biosynthesis protein FlhG
MSDQAQVLRGLVEHREESLARGASKPRTTPALTVAVTSGKGGVGKSNLALNLGISLAEMGHSVCVLDANLGLGNLDLLCGLNGYWNLSHVISGARTLREISLAGPGGIHLIPGASGLTALADCSLSAQQEILQQLEELEQQHEFLLIDTGTGIHHAVCQFVSAADLGLVITTPEPTAIADAYATLKAFSAHPRVPDLEIVVNRADSTEQARDIIARLQRTTRMFLRNEVRSAGQIPDDIHVAQSVKRQTPFRIAFPTCPASRAVDNLARRVNHLCHREAPPEPVTFFNRLWPRLSRPAA